MVNFLQYINVNQNNLKKFQQLKLLKNLNYQKQKNNYQRNLNYPIYNRHEVEIMKILNHSCIIKFHELIESKTHINIITELVKDGDLFDYVVNRENLNEYEAA